jgi:hypothetical protein
VRRRSKFKRGCAGLIVLSILLKILVVPALPEKQDSPVKSPDGAGPYVVSYIDIFNISRTGGRWLPISIYFPAMIISEESKPNFTRAPYPTLLFSVGYTLNIASGRAIAERVSSWGFVFVIVGSNLNYYDYERSRDVIETLNWLEVQNDNSSFMLNQMIDETKLGVLGHSMGGAAAIVASINETRFKVLVPVDPAPPSSTRATNEFSAADIHIPILILIGLGGGRSDERAQYYEAANPPKFQILLADIGHTAIRSHPISFKYIVPFLKVYLCGELDYVEYLYGSYAGQDIEEGKIELFYDTSEGAAVFELSSLTIDPSSVEVGGEVSVCVEVANTGDKSGTYNVTLKIDDDVEEEKAVSLNPDEVETVSFDVSASEPGTVSVEIDGLSGSYTVTEPEEPSFWERIPGFQYESIVLGLAIGVLVLLLIQRRR